MNPGRLLIYAIIKSLIWIAIGFAFGSASVILIFTSKIIYDTPKSFSDLITPDYIMFLCVSLMAGTSADYFNSPDKKWSDRWLPLILSFCLLIILCFVFHPFVALKPDKEILEWMTLIYLTITIVFCGIYKSILFYEEGVHLTRTKF